jgi:hypothetical protein
MMHKRKFPVGERIGGLSDAEFINLISWQLMPRALEIRAFLDEGDRLGLKYSPETMLGIADEMFSGLALLWAGQSPEGQERMIEQCLPWWIEVRALEEQIAAKAKPMLAQRKAKQ